MSTDIKIELQTSTPALDWPKNPWSLWRSLRMPLLVRIKPQKMNLNTRKG
jgi:hypothetical protein